MVILSSSFMLLIFYIRIVEKVARAKGQGNFQSEAINEMCEAAASSYTRTNFVTKNFPDYPRSHVYVAQVCFFHG